MFVRLDREIVWTPYVDTQGISICLQWVFAQRCIAYKLSDPAELCAQIWRAMEGRGTASSTLFVSYQGSLLPQVFQMGRDGIWLAIENTPVESCPVEYSSHNADRSAWDRE